LLPNCLSPVLAQAARTPESFLQSLWWRRSCQWGKTRWKRAKSTSKNYL